MTVWGCYKTLVLGINHPIPRSVIVSFPGGGSCDIYPQSPTQKKGCVTFLHNTKYIVSRRVSCEIRTQHQNNHIHNSNITHRRRVWYHTHEGELRFLWHLHSCHLGKKQLAWSVSVNRKINVSSYVHTVSSRYNNIVTRSHSFVMVGNQQVC